MRNWNIFLTRCQREQSVNWNLRSRKKRWGIFSCALDVKVRNRKLLWQWFKICARNTHEISPLMFSEELHPFSHFSNFDSSWKAFYSQPSPKCKHIDARCDCCYFLLTPTSLSFWSASEIYQINLILICWQNKI